LSDILADGRADSACHGVSGLVGVEASVGAEARLVVKLLCKALAVQLVALGQRPQRLVQPVRQA